MQAFMKRNRLWAACVALLVSLGLAVYAQLSLDAIPAHLQFLWPAPAPSADSADSAAAGDNANTTETQAPKAALANDGLRAARLAMDAFNEQLEGACKPASLYAVADGISVIAKMDNATAVTARLEASDDLAYSIKSLTVQSGRLIYTEELLRGERVALVDEKLAVALFNYAEPRDRELLWGPDKYRIVGILNDQKKVGDHQEYTLYVPFRAIERVAQPMTALCAETVPLPNAGGWGAFETASASLSTQGTCLSLPKEAMNAALPFRLICCMFGFIVILFGLRALNVRAMGLYADYRARLRDQYAAQLVPRFGWRVILLGMGYAVCAALFAQLFMVLVEPVYTFPEWIPAVLVEPKDISTVFWNVWQKQASLLELRSPELVRIRFFREIMGWACGGIALSGGILWARLSDSIRWLTDRKPAEKEPEAQADTPSCE